MRSSEVASLEGHLRGCPNCQRQVTALRRIIDLVGSLDQIETSPDFLAQVRAKIERKAPLARLRARLFEPATAKVTLAIMSLLPLIVLAFYIFRQPAEPPQEGAIPTTLRDLQASREIASEASEKSVKAASLQAPEANLPVLPASSSESTDVRRSGFFEMIPAGTPSQFQEIIADDVGRYEQRVKILLAEVGGKVLIQERFTGLSLTVEMPESRRAEFISALKGEVKPKREHEEKITVTAATTADQKPAASHKSDPPVTFQLRIVPKP